MNLLMINYEFPPIGGGGANANKYLLREFAYRNELEVDLITSSERECDYIDKFSENITIHRLDVGKKRLHYWTQLEILKFLYRSSCYVKLMLKKKSYHVSHSFFAFPSGYISYRLKAKIPYVISLRGSDVPGFNQRFLMQYFFLTHIFRRIWRGANAVIANSHDLKDLALGTCPELNMDIIYNGIDTEEFSPAEKSANRTFNILCVSRLIGRKGVDYLIKSLPAILKCQSTVKLIIVGEGNQELELKELSSRLGLTEHIIFKGYMRHEELPVIYRESDLFVLPSLWEGMSNSLLEAIASGLPVIVTDTGGTRELVNDNGIIIPKADSMAISESVIRLLNNKELRTRMGLKSREIAMKFSWKNVAEQYIKYYERCVIPTKPG